MAARGAAFNLNAVKKLGKKCMRPRRVVHYDPATVAT